MPIHVLSPEVTAKIAAGEVVERPASVVKELIENALDAGARAIHIEIQEGGHRLIRLLYDGGGMPAADVELAFTRHSTSKLIRAEDLECIRNFGFRGEALASISAFEEFRRSVVASRDLLFTQVLESVDSFLPELFFPKQFSTKSTAALFGGHLPLPDWKEWMERVLDFSLRSDFGRHP